MAHTFLLGLRETDKNIIFLTENGRNEKEIRFSLQIVFSLIPLMMRN